MTTTHTSPLTEWKTRSVYKLLSVRARLARRQRALEQRPAVGLRSFLQGQRKRYSCSRPPALADCDGRAATIQRTMHYDNHRRTVALIDDRRTAQRGDARACCRGGPCEAGCTGPDRHGANDSLPRQHRPICFWHLLTPSQSSRSRIMGIRCIWHIRVRSSRWGIYMRMFYVVRPSLHSGTDGIPRIALLPQSLVLASRAHMPHLHCSPC